MNLSLNLGGGGGAKSKEQTSGEVEEANMFKQLCENVTTAMFTLNNIFQEVKINCTSSFSHSISKIHFSQFLQFKDEILKVSIEN